MTSTTSATRTARTVGAALAIIHEDWIRQVTAYLAPATDLRSDFWSRWGAARFLADQFGDRFRLECAFAAALEGHIPPDAAQHLAAAREDLECTREELIAAARRRDTSELTAVLARRLLKEIARWCVELELAAEQFDPTDLSVAARRLLARLGVPEARAASCPANVT